MLVQFGLLQGACEEKAAGMKAYATACASLRLAARPGAFQV